MSDSQELLFDDERYKKTKAHSVTYKYVREDEYKKLEKELAQAWGYIERLSKKYGFELEDLYPIAQWKKEQEK